MSVSVNIIRRTACKVLIAPFHILEARSTTGSVADEERCVSLLKFVRRLSACIATTIWVICLRDRVPLQLLTSDVKLAVGGMAKIFPLVVTHEMDDLHLQSLLAVREWENEKPTLGIRIHRWYRDTSWLYYAISIQCYIRSKTTLPCTNVRHK